MRIHEIYKSDSMSVNVHFCKLTNTPTLIMVRIKNHRVIKVRLPEGNVFVDELNKIVPPTPIEPPPPHTTKKPTDILRWGLSIGVSVIASILTVLTML